MKKAVKVSVIVVAAAIAVSAVVFPVLGACGRLQRQFSTPTPKKDTIKISCIGDSVTYGTTLINRNTANYPHQLSLLLGEKYSVGNFGYSGRCVQSTANKPYRSESLYDGAKKYSPDIILFMMGSNDSKAFNYQGKEHFKEEYEGFVKELLAFESKPKVYILTAPSQFGKGNVVAFQINKSNTKEIVEVQKEVAEKYGLEIIDINAFTSGKRNLFSADGVHPNSEGAKNIAQYIYSKIK